MLHQPVGMVGLYRSDWHWYGTHRFESDMNLRAYKIYEAYPMKYANSFVMSCFGHNLVIKFIIFGYPYHSELLHGHWSYIKCTRCQWCNLESYIGKIIHDLTTKKYSKARIVSWDDIIQHSTNHARDSCLSCFLLFVVIMYINSSSSVHFFQSHQWIQNGVTVRKCSGKNLQISVTKKSAWIHIQLTKHVT